jgi:small GTP-binding protein
LVSEITETPPQPIVDRQALHRILVEQFSESELRDLCFDLNVDLDNLAGASKRDKARELVVYLDRRGRTSDLTTFLHRLRPRALWPDLTPSLPPEKIPIETLELLAEAKLILVGDGNVGKTSLVNRLVYDSFNDAESTTRGIAITKWFIDLPRSDVQRARLNIWDFGGQGSMHATHPYFFSRRAVYLVVLNVREDIRVNRIEYWLRLIRTYGAESPIIIVSNKIDQYPGRLDELTLQGKYGIFDFVRTSCVNGEGIFELRAMIAKAVCSFEDIATRTPASFVKLRRTLEIMMDSTAVQLRDTMSLDEYNVLCDRHGVDASQRDGFLRRLNDLGAMLYFGDDARLELNVVLNPFWVTEGIYRILNHESLIQAGGKLKVEQIRGILPRDRYPPDKAMYILDMMCKFELCFALDEKQTLFLLPDLLPPQQPRLPFFDSADALKLQFEYPVWQGVTLTRLFVRLNQYLVEDAYWRNGALLQSLDNNNRALVMADEVDRRLRLWVDGNPATRRNLLNRIREELNVIHGNQREQIKELVITPQGGEVSYQLLVSLEAKGAKTYDVLIGDKLIELDVKELLSGVRAEVLPDPVRLKDLIVKHLSLDEIDDLCFSFAINLEDIEGDGKEAKARNLVRRFERRLQIPRLMAVLRDSYPKMAWV